MSRRIVVAALALLAFGPAEIVSSNRACASETNHAAVVVRSGDSQANFCVTFETPQIGGLEALRRTGLSVVTKQFGEMGGFVCMIGDVGTSVEDCPAADGSHWAYFRGESGSWRSSARGASSTRVACGGLEGWSWKPQGSGPLPTAVTFDSVCMGKGCGKAASSAPEVPPPPAPAAKPRSPWKEISPVPYEDPTAEPNEDSKAAALMTPSPPPSLRAGKAQDKSVNWSAYIALALAALFIGFLRFITLRRGGEH